MFRNAKSEGLVTTPPCLMAGAANTAHPSQASVLFSLGEQGSAGKWGLVAPKAGKERGVEEGEERKEGRREGGERRKEGTGGWRRQEGWRKEGVE